MNPPSIADVGRSGCNRPTLFPLSAALRVQGTGRQPYPSSARGGCSPYTRGTWSFARSATRKTPPAFRLCGYCGAPLAVPGPALPQREVRRTVTIIFCDLKGSTELGESLDTRGAARGQAALLPGDGGRDHPPRRQDREVHRRRDHGRVRSAAAARGRRAARAARRARHARGAEERQRRAEGALRRRARESHRHQHRRGGRGRRPGGRPAARDRRRRQRRGAPRAGRAARRDLSGRRHLSPRARRDRGRGRRAVDAERQERAGRRVPADRRERARRLRPARRQPDRRPRGRARRGRGVTRRADGIAHRARGHDPGPRRHRQVAPVARGDGTCCRRRCAHRPGPLPALRGRHHVLAAARHRQRRRRDTSRRQPRGSPRQARRADRRRGRDRPARLGDRPEHGRVRPARDQLGGAQVSREARRRTGRWSP